MNRNEWVFEYSASKLASAAEVKRDQHNERLEFWLKKKTEVMAEVKECGLEVHETLASTASNDYNPLLSRGPQVVVRNDLQQKLTECHGKLKEHESKWREYDGWYQVLTANPENVIQLHHDDWLYFFSK